MASGVGKSAALETAFNSAVQAGLVQAAIANALGALGSGVNVMAADPVQAQRYAVQLALQQATSSLQVASNLVNADSAALSPTAAAATTGGGSSSPASCGRQDIKVWYPVGIAFIIFASVMLLLLVGAAAFKAGAATAVHPAQKVSDPEDFEPKSQHSPAEKVHPYPPRDA